MNLDSELWHKMARVADRIIGDYITERDIAIALLDLRREVEALKAKLEGGK